MHDKVYLKLWEQVRKSLTDKVAVIRVEVVRIAVEIEQRYGVHSCLEEARCELQHDDDRCVRELLS